jgi:hypothetical protein
LKNIATCEKYQGKGYGIVINMNKKEIAPGGLPPALMTGRTAVQYLCRDSDTLFISEE